MRQNHYILEGKTPKLVDLITWAIWFAKADRQILRDSVGEVVVSTVFLGLDHNYWDEGEPLIFETMVFGGELDGEQQRYSTYEEAENGHEIMLEKVKDDTAILEAEIIY